MSGFLGKLTSSQEKALKIFREEVASIPNKPSNRDEYYLKWLRARKFDLDGALTMFRNHMEWRKENNVDTVSEWKPPEVLEKYMTGSFLGEDRNGHPVFYDFLGNVDSKGLYRSCKSEDAIRYKIMQGEEGNILLEQQSEKYGRYIETITAVVNMENLSYQRQFYWPAIQLIRQAFALYADNYPERTEAIFIINAPRVFPVAYNLIKNFMDEATKSRLYVLGDDYKEVLLQHIAPDQLPAAYGGQRLEPDPECTGVLKRGGQVPESYYLTNQTSVRKESMNRVTVRRSSVHEHHVEVKTTGCLLRWEFLTEDYDIGFSLHHKSEVDEERTVLVQSERYNSHVVPEEGVHHCKFTGTYTLVFDNTHSWMRSKELFYFVESQDSSSNGDQNAMDFDLIANEQFPSFSIHSKENDEEPADEHDGENMLSNGHS